MISKRISDISYNEGEFDKAAPVYNKALQESGYSKTLVYQNEVKPKRNRNRKIIWFNPPYNKNVKTNVGKRFLELIDKYIINSISFSTRTMSK